MDEDRERRRLIAAFETGTDIAKLCDWASRYSIDRARILFKETGNAFHAWEGYRWARLNDRPVPDWVLDYLDGCAKSLEDIKPRSAKQVAQAFGMAVPSGMSKFGLALCQSDRLALFQSVMAMKEREETVERDEALGVTDPKIVRFKRDLDIFAHIAVERDVSIDQVEAAYYEFRS